ncbi:MAG: hypothetical protein U9R77_04400 [Pseudomonadota bacterium]|nr:hypothetical protein [Pseudomonadota bacterium]
MRDFSLKIYESLLQTLLEKNYSFHTLQDFIKLLNSSTHQLFNFPLIILRHDVDSWPSNALQMAYLENNLNVNSTYYFRMHSQSYNENIIKRISELGHEIGYHYEDLANVNGNFEKAFEEFKINLEKLRKLYPVKSISMHGRPLSKWDSRDLWKKYDYKKLGVTCEPYLDIDYDKVLYLTDTGGCWDGEKYNLRDNVKSKFGFDIHSTFDLIDHIEHDKLPNQIILNIHPARWNNNLFKWLIRQFILTYPKRGVKSILKKMRNKK